MMGSGALAAHYRDATEMERIPFLEGQTTIACETGLDPSATVDVYVLGKAQAGQSLKPSLKMDGAPGTSFREENLSTHFTMPDCEELNLAKKSLMPLQVRADAAGDMLVVSWDISGCSNYTGIKAFRSQERAVGDYATVGGKVFEGYGTTNRFELFRWDEDGTILSPLGLDATGLSRFFDHPPVEPQPIGHRKLVAASNLRLGGTEKFEGLLHFIDTPPEHNVVFTYTIYAFDRTGNQSYPVIVNAAIDPSATNCTFRLVQ